MIDNLRSVAIFAEAIKSGSFRAAANNLGLSPSVVSYHISQLEQRLGSALIYRSTRKLSLSHEGEILYQYASDMLGSFQQGIDEVTSVSHQPRGKLKLSMPAVLIQSTLNQKLAGFSKQYPGIELDIIYTDTRQDLIGQGIDLAIRAGEMQDSSLKSKRLGKIKRKLVCSPEYLENRAMPEHPSELESWNWIKLAMLPNMRELKRGNDISVEVNFRSNISVDNVDAMARLCILGLGVSTPPIYLVDEALEHGELIELLPDWQVEPVSLHACWPENVSADSNTRRLLAYLSQA